MASLLRLRSVPVISIPERPVLRPYLRPMAVSAQSSRQMPGAATYSSKLLVKDAARVGLITILKAIAATKLYQARTVHAVATTTLLVMHAVVPSTDQQRGSSPSASPVESTDLDKPAIPATTTTTTTIADSLSTHLPPATTTTTGILDSPIISTPSTHISCTMLEAAIWTDEVRHLQTRRSQLLTDLQHICATLAASTASASASKAAAVTGPAPPQAEVYFVSSGPEFCGLTCQVESCPEIEQLRTNLKRQIHAMASRMVAHGATPYAASGGVTSSHNNPGIPSPFAGLPQLHFLDQVLEMSSPRLPGVGGLAGVGAGLANVIADEAQQLKELQKVWNATAQEVTHLLVRLAVAKQLPAQPKQRITVSYVREEVINHLYERLAALSSF